MAVHLQWGPELARPEAERFGERCTGLAPAEVAALFAEVAAASSLAHRIVEDGAAPGQPDRATGEAGAAVLAAHPWIDEENLRQLLWQASYSAWRG